MRSGFWGSMSSECATDCFANAVDVRASSCWNYQFVDDCDAECYWDLSESDKQHRYHGRLYPDEYMWQSPGAEHKLLGSGCFQAHSNGYTDRPARSK